MFRHLLNDLIKNGKHTLLLTILNYELNLRAYHRIKYSKQS